MPPIISHRGPEGCELQFSCHIRRGGRLRHLAKLSALDATIRFSFTTEKEYAEEWKIEFRSSFGQPKDSVIAITMKLGATLTTDGPDSEPR